MLKIDYDDYRTASVLKTERFLFSIPLPFFIRKSSSGKGLHIMCPSLGTWDFRRFIFDDKMRIELDERREEKRLPISNLLWDRKNGKTAHPWSLISTQSQIADILDTYIEIPKDIYIEEA